MFIFIGLLLGLIGAVVPSGATAALLVAGFNPYACLGCFICLQVLNTWRELATPRQSGNIEELAVKGKRLRFRCEKELDAIALQLVSLKLVLMIGGVLMGALIVSMYADKVSQVAPFILGFVLVLTIRRTPPQELPGTICALVAMVALIVSLQWVPAMVPILYLCLAQAPQTEDDQEVEAAWEMKRLGAHFFHIVVWAIPVGMVPGLNASTITNLANPVGADNKLSVLSLNSMAEGISLGILLFGRNTGKTVLTDLMSKHGGLVASEVTAHFTFAIVGSLVIIPAFLWFLRGCPGSVQVLSRSRTGYGQDLSRFCPDLGQSRVGGFRLEFPTRYGIQKPWLPSISQLLTVGVGTWYASVNPFSFMFPLSGTLFGFTLVVVMLCASKFTIYLPDRTRSLLAGLPILFL